MMEHKLFYSSPDLASWETVITDIKEADGKYIVQLAETAFYPEGGGQPADQGTINGRKVLDVYEDGDFIFHVLSENPGETRAECKIDWSRRFDHMQQHTGQHLLSAVCIELCEAKTVSFHLGAEIVTIDLEVPSLSSEQLQEIEDQTNQYIYENRPIKTYMADYDELHKIPLRKLPEVTENIRIVEIDGIDFSACCGTHVQSTGQLGLIKLLKTEKNKGNTRLYFKCGIRALKDYQQTYKILSDVASRFSSSHDDVPAKLDKMENDCKLLQRKMDQVTDEMNFYVAKELISEQNGFLLTASFEDKTVKDLQGLAKQVFTFGERAVILSSLSESKVLLAHNGVSSLNSGQAFKELLPAFNGKGGGNATQAQASFSTLEDLHKFVAALIKMLSSSN